GDLVALPEVALRFVELLKVRARHAEVVVGDRAAMLVVRRTVGLEGPPIARQRFVEVALDVREDAEILLDPRAQLAALAAQPAGSAAAIAASYNAAASGMQAARSRARASWSRSAAGRTGARGPVCVGAVTSGAVIVSSPGDGVVGEVVHLPGDLLREEVIQRQQVAEDIQ